MRRKFLWMIPAVVAFGLAAPAQTTQQAPKEQSSCCGKCCKQGKSQTAKGDHHRHQHGKQTPPKTGQ